jgi:hypothetical protein
MGGRLLPNARGARWFLKAFGIKKAHRHLVASGAGALRIGTRSTPTPRQILVIVQSLIYGDAFHHVLIRANPSAAREPNRGLTRLMGTGIVGSNPCGVIPDISSAAAAQSL